MFRFALEFFLRLLLHLRAAVERVRRLWANVRKHLHIWDAWQWLSSWSTQTHTHTDLRAFTQQKLRNLGFDMCKHNMAARKLYSVWMGYTPPRVLVGTCHWGKGEKRSSLSHRIVLKHVLSEKQKCVRLTGRKYTSLFYTTIFSHIDEVCHHFSIEGQSFCTAPIEGQI